MALAEIRVQIHALGMKRIMLSNSLLLEHWPLASKQHIWLWQRYPRGKDIRSSDGDAVRPLEMLSNGRISRLQISKELSRFVTVFTPCLISTPHVIGSNIEKMDRSRWVVAWTMVNDLPIFKDLWTGAKYRTKDFKAFPLPTGMTCYEFLGMTIPTGKVAKFNHPGESATPPHRIITLNDAAIDRLSHQAKLPSKPAPNQPYHAEGGTSQHTLIDKDGYIMQREAESGNLVKTDRHISDHHQKPEPGLEQPGPADDLLRLVTHPVVVDLAFTALPCSSVASPGCSPSLLGTELTILRGRGAAYKQGGASDLD